MDSIAEFEAALTARPDNWTLRAEYAAWLEDHGRGNDPVAAAGQRYQATHQLLPWEDTQTSNWVWFTDADPHQAAAPTAILPDALFIAIANLWLTSGASGVIALQFCSRREAEGNLARALAQMP